MKEKHIYYKATTKNNNILCKLIEYCIHISFFQNTAEMSETYQKGLQVDFHRMTE